VPKHLVAVPSRNYDRLNFRFQIIHRIQDFNLGCSRRHPGQKRLDTYEIDYGLGEQIAPEMVLVALFEAQQHLVTETELHCLGLIDHSYVWVGAELSVGTLDHEVKQNIGCRPIIDKWSNTLRFQTRTKFQKVLERAIYDMTYAPVKRV